MGSLAGKVIFITGASRGIESDRASTAEDGAKVVIAAKLRSRTEASGQFTPRRMRSALLAEKPYP